MPRCRRHADGTGRGMNGPPPFPVGGPRSVIKIGKRHLEDPGHTQQGGQLHLLTGLRVLKGSPVDAGGLPHLILREVLTKTFRPEMRANGPSAFRNPRVVFG